MTQSSFNLHHYILGITESQEGYHGNKYDNDFQPEILTKGKKYKKGDNLKIIYYKIIFFCNALHLIFTKGASYVAMML